MTSRWRECSRSIFGKTAVGIILAVVLLEQDKAMATDVSLWSGPFVARDVRGQVFKVDDQGRLCHRWRTSDGGWSAWCGLGGSFTPAISVVSDSLGRMQVFGVDRTNGCLETIWQLSTNHLDWSASLRLGSGFAAPVAAVRADDGGIEVFAVDAATHHVKWFWQTNAAGDWQGPVDLGGSLQPGLAAASNGDGRIEVFGLGTGDGVLMHCWQLRTNSPDQWSDWKNLGGAIGPGFTTGLNAIGRLEVFGVNRTNNAVNRICQAVPGDSGRWGAWDDFGGDVKPGLAVGLCGDGRLEVFAINAVNAQLLHRWELFVHGSDEWSAWAELGQRAATFPAVGTNEDGNLEVFALDPSAPGVIHYRRQIGAASDWLDWSTLDRPVFHYTTRTWQVDEGLPANVVQAIAQTADGFLWVGTPRGLARFDGSEFVCYNAENTPPLGNSSITALCADKGGALWIGTDGGGLVRLKNGVFTRFAVTNGLAGNKVEVIYESRDGALWVGTEAGMSSYRDGQFHNYTGRDGLLSDSVRCIEEDRDGNLWIATGKGLNRLRRTGTMDAFVMPNRLPNDAVRVICQDQGGRIWIGSNNGLLWYDWFWGNDFYAYNGKYGLSDTFVSAICEDGDDNLWVGTYSGLNRFHDGRFYSQLDGDGQPFDRVNALFVDREGDLWVGSKEGLSRLTPQKFFTCAKPQGLTHNNVTSILQDAAGSMWVGTWGGGLDNIDGEKISGYPTVDATNALSQDLILSLAEGHDGSLWVGADFDGGLTRLKDGRLTRYTWRDGLIDAGLRVLHPDAVGNLWIGTDRGLSCLRDGMFVTNPVTAGLAGDGIRDIGEDRSGALWFATQDGLARWQDGRLTRFTEADGLSDHVLNALYVDDDNTLWIGSNSGGLIRYRNGRFTSYKLQQGLFSNEILAILEDRGWLWLSCSQGIFRVRKKDFDAYDQGKMETIASVAYGKNDGMESPQCNGNGKPAAWKSRDGRLWFPTSKGLVTVDPKTIRLDEEMPSVFIETVVADERMVDGGRHELAGAASVLRRRTTPLRIAAGRGELEFQYAALDFTAPEKERFQYRLEGVDTTWVNAGIRRVAYYNNLAPGTYRFQVKACNQDGIWNEAGAAMTVVLLPHYWQTFWFRSLVVVGILGAACGSVLYGTRRRMQRKLVLLEQQQAVERERGRIARDMHDQIGAGLTQIGLLGEFVRRDLERNGHSRVHAERICDAARELAQTLDVIVWMVNPKNDTVNKLGLYLAAYAEEFFRVTTVRCRLEVPPGLPSTRLPAEVRHNVFLTVKEALNNIVKYSRAGAAQLRVAAPDGMLEIEIEDNGVGFAVESANLSRNGLSNMKERIEEVGGVFEISSCLGAGTRIRMHIPISSPPKPENGPSVTIQGN